MFYRVVVRIWDPIWLTVFLLWFFSVRKVTYIYYAIISRVQYVALCTLCTEKNHSKNTVSHMGSQMHTITF